MDPIELLQDLVRQPGPPGQEDAVRDLLKLKLNDIGIKPKTDAKGNLIVSFGKSEKPKVVVTAHMDEIALYVREVETTGNLKVTSIGGLWPWKLGEGPVTILAQTGHIEGVLGFGSIHTESEKSAAKRAKTNAILWDAATIHTGLTHDQLVAKGVRLGTRVVVSTSRRTLTQYGDFVSGYFLDDRADLVSWLLIIDQIKDLNLDVSFVATTSEEVGGEGALYYLNQVQPDVCIALELGPNVPDAPVEIDARPTVWVNDGHAAMPPFLGELMSKVSQQTGIGIQFQALSRGGSDASCAAGKGLCAHPLTLGLAMENSHGYEIIHKGSMKALADLTVAVLHSLKS